MLVFRYCLETIQRFEWDDNQPKAEKFEERITIKMVIGLTIKALLKSKIFIVSN